MSNLENIFKEKLIDYKSPVSDTVWQSVANSLNQEKKKRRLYLLYLLLGLILGSIFIGLLLHSKSNKEGNRLKSQPIYKIDEAEDSNNVFNSPKVSNELVSTNTLSENIVTNNKNIVTNNKITNITKENATNSISSAIDKYPINLRVENKIINTTITDKDINAFNIKNKFNNNGLSNTKLITNRKFAHIDYVNTKLKNPYTSFVREKFLLDYQPQYFSGRINQEEIDNCFPVKVNSWFTEIYFSPDFASKKLFGTEKRYINSRLKSESSKLSFSTGFMFGYLFNRGASLKTGFNYSQINEKFRPVKELKIITIDSIAGTIDTSYKVVYIDETQKAIKYNTLDIPVILGLDYKTGNNKFGINIGFVLNLTTFRKGYMVNIEGETIRFGNKEIGNEIFEKNLGLSTYFSLIYSYRIGNNNELFIEPRTRYYIKSFTKSSYPLKQKYASYGLSFGARYIL